MRPHPLFLLENVKIEAFLVWYWQRSILFEIRDETLQVNSIYFYQK